MQLLSEHNRILRVGEGGSQEYFAGPNINITDHVISGKYWDNEINSAISSTSGDIVNEAFNQSTAWVDEQGYLTAHQDVTNLPYVQNSALEFSPQGLISGISGSGLYATSAENAFTADTAYFAYNAEHADSADYVESAHSAQYAQSANSALNAEVSNVAYTALTANFLEGGWEYDENSAITAYNGSAFHAQGGDYSGISPIVVDNDERIISAKSALLGVQDPLYFVEDSETATVIGIHESAISGQGIEYSGIAPIVVDNENHLISAQSAKLGVQGPLYFVEDTPTSTVIGIDNSAFPTFETNSEGEVSAINGSAIYATDVVEYSGSTNIDITDHIISVTGSVPSADRADYAVSATSSNFSHSAIEAASANSTTYDNLGREITATYLTAVTGDNTPYSAGANIDITNHVVSGKDWTSEIQAASANAVTEATNTITAVELANSALTANYSKSADSATYDNLGREITATYLTAEVEYTAGANIDITNHVVSGKDWTSDISAASSYAYDQATAQIPAVTGLPYVENSALDYTPGGHLVSSISGDALYAVSAEGAFNAETANYSYVAETANYVADGWEYDGDNYITGYSGSAFAGQGGGIEYTGIAPIVVNNAEHKISAQSAVLGVQSPLYFVEDSVSATIIGISGLPEGQGIMYESALGLSAGSITSYNNSAFGGGGVQSDWTETATTNLAYIKHKPSEYNLVAGQNVTLTLAGNDLTIDAIGGGSTITYTTGSI